MLPEPVWQCHMQARVICTPPIETPDFIYIVELKYDRTSEEGARQIENKEYALPFRFDGRKVFKIGVNFSASTRHLDTPVITRMTTARK